MLELYVSAEIVIRVSPEDIDVIKTLLDIRKLVRNVTFMYYMIKNRK